MRTTAWGQVRRQLPVVGIAVVQLVGTYFAALHQPGVRPLDAGAVALLLLGPAVLTVRHRYPAAVLGGVLLVTLVYDLLDYPRGPVFLSLIVAFFTAVGAGRRRVAWAALVTGYLAFLWLGFLLGRQPAPTVAGVVGLGAWLLVLLAVAETVRIRRERAAEEARSRQEEARRRASEERLLIARELHDVLAHNISLINVQAGVALHLIDEQPEQARTALAAIKDASKDTLRELRSTLGMLRAVDEDLPRSPAPSLSQLDTLVTRVEGTGLVVRTEIVGAPRPLPAGVDRAAFRIVQEALTNVTRHAGAATATVRVAYAPTELTLEVDDDGRGGAPSAGSGSGIPGMRERATALGGRLEAGPRPDARGFRVVARLPLEDEA